MSDTATTHRAPPCAVGFGRVVVLAGILIGVAVASGLAAWLTVSGGFGDWVWLVWLTTILGMICVADIRERRIPNRFVALLAAMGLGWWITTAALTQIPGILLTGAIAAAATGALYFVLGVAGVFGLGDVKLAGTLAFLLGCAAGNTTTWMLFPIIAIVIGGIDSLIRRTRRIQRGAPHAIALTIAALTTAMLTAI